MPPDKLSPLASSKGMASRLAITQFTLERKTKERFER